jgi:hypothetical protein
MQKQIPPRRAGGVEYALANQGVEFSVASLQKGKFDLQGGICLFI